MPELQTEGELFKKSSSIVNAPVNLSPLTSTSSMMSASPTKFPVASYRSLINLTENPGPSRFHVPCPSLPLKGKSGDSDADMKFTYVLVSVMTPPPA